jgi:flavin reductase (DIM6/NTAB) family NADH-FMN oxidoreductase RutF
VTVPARESAALPKSELDPSQMADLDVYKILAGCIVPRPIGFMTTIARDGVVNAAPFSFFNMISHIPPLVGFSVARKPTGPKDTLTNVVDSGEFVVNIVNEEIVAAADVCSGLFAPEVDELALSGLTAVASSVVRAPRIAESPVNFECRLLQTVLFPGSPSTFIIGQVLRMHVRQNVLLAGHRIDHSALAAVGRMAGNSYCRTSDTFSLDHDTFTVLAQNGG